MGKEEEEDDDDESKDEDESKIGVACLLFIGQQWIDRVKTDKALGSDASGTQKDFGGSTDCKNVFLKIFASPTVCKMRRALTNAG
jgi:hypothetical protein